MKKIFKVLLFLLPESPLFNKIKKYYLVKSGLVLKKCDIFKINSGLEIKGNVKFRGNLSINKNVNIISSKDTLIDIGNNILIGPNVVIRSCNHGISKYHPMIKMKKDCADIVIGENVWIAANVVVTPGVTIEDNCVIGAGSVLPRGTYHTNSIYAGNPAKLIKEIK